MRLYTKVVVLFECHIHIWNGIEKRLIVVNLHTYRNYLKKKINPEISHSDHQVGDCVSGSFLAD